MVVILFSDLRTTLGKKNEHANTIAKAISHDLSQLTKLKLSIPALINVNVKDTKAVNVPA